MINPCSNKKLIDVACGTGDIGKLYLDYTDINSQVTCVDPNQGMINQGKKKLANYKNIEYFQSIHDVSDGGALTSVCESAIGNELGFHFRFQIVLLLVKVVEILTQHS